MCIRDRDTNNFTKKTGVGERESRIACPLVARRHYFMGHGIGRSGEVNSAQPKAVGSSLLLKLTQALSFDALRLMGYDFVQELVVLPLATGMALTMSLLAASAARKEAKTVIWPRIDQKTCLKCIAAANLVPLPVDGVVEGDAIRTDLATIEKILASEEGRNVLAIVSTTSCFAPRVPDDVEALAKLAKQYDIFHIINNAYGLQCTKIAHSVNQASKHGRVDAVVQSTDKNFLVPVGGSIVFCPTRDGLVPAIASSYPGRASASPIVDLFLTFLSLGKKGLRELLDQRRENREFLKVELEKLAQKHGERVFNLKKNTISFGMTLIGVAERIAQGDGNVGNVGSRLFRKRVMGCRVVQSAPPKAIAGIPFANYGSHHAAYPHLPYLTVACAIGQTRAEIILFLERLDKTLLEIKAPSAPPKPPSIKPDEESKAEELTNPASNDIKEGSSV
eukprot:TRINITY_DN6263_c0_g1_i3.p1 TRINITY_DN6263_c0_g1~~TRINITY_DN6263_c0_g1_i3.p1  ORF type:complete len:469 (-),score=108.39 TRINITY_DN6263_c0_g1_i3:81-1427(-)